MGSCSLLFDALRSSSRAGAIRLQRKTWPLRSRSNLSEGLGAASGRHCRGSLAYRLFSRPALGAGLVALRQTFVRRCHGGLGSPGLPGIDKSSMMAGKAARPWDVATSVQTDPPLFMRLSFQRLREALAGSMPASFHHAASLPRADCSSRPLWLPVRNSAHARNRDQEFPWSVPLLPCRVPDHARA